MHIGTYFLESAKTKIKELRGDFEESSHNWPVSPLPQPEMALELMNYKGLEGEDAEKLRAAALALTKEDPSTEEIFDIYNARDLIYDIDPESQPSGYFGLNSLFDSCEWSLTVSNASDSIRTRNERLATEEFDTLS